MKSKIILFLIIFGLFSSAIFLLLKPEAKAPHHSALIQKEERAPAPDPIEYLISSLEKEPKGLVISPKSTEELQAYFAEATPLAVPRIFVQNLPSDFSEKGTQKLFAQVFSALILRENERVLTERAILVLLNAKREKGIAWTEAETDYFNSLVKKYDSRAKREESSEMADLLNKLGRIPPLVAVAQAAVETNWGRKNLQSPFGQMGWIDVRNYVPLKFDSLPQAISSYAVEMNGLPSLQDWRFTRSMLHNRNQGNIGYRILRVLGDYKQEDPKYTQKLQESVKELGYEIPDSLTFLPWISFEKGTIHIQTKNGKIPFQVEIAKEPKQQARGLMFRGNLADGTGMLFLNKTEEPYAMWMKNTYIPLDIVFFDKSARIRTIIENAEPLSLKSRPSVVPVLGAIELPAGTVQKYGIQVRDKVIY